MQTDNNKTIGGNINIKDEIKKNSRAKEVTLSYVTYQSRFKNNVSWEQFPIDFSCFCVSLKQRQPFSFCTHLFSRIFI